jgi:hypothetical protein
MIQKTVGMGLAAALLLGSSLDAGAQLVREYTGMGLHKRAVGREPCSQYCPRKWGFSPYLVSRCYYQLGHCDHSR